MLWLLWPVALMPIRETGLAVAGRCLCIPGGATDDPGLYAILAPAIAAGMPVLLAWRLLAVGIAAVAFWASPYRLASAVALTFALLVGDVYIIPAAVIVVALPRLVERRQLVGVVVVALAAELVRSGAGLPALVGAAIVIRRPLPVLAIAALYLGLHSITGHVFWHTVYIGLVGPYLDETAFAFVNGRAPHLSPEYEAILRSEVFRLITTAPLWALGVYGGKLLALPLLWLGLLLGRRSVLFLAVVLAAALPAILAIPVLTYQTGLAAATIIILAQRIPARAETRAGLGPKTS